MLPKKSFSLSDKLAGVKPDRVKVGVKKKRSAVRRAVDKIKNVIDKKEV